MAKLQYFFHKFCNSTFWLWVKFIYECPQRCLAYLFYNLGCRIARRPWLFILIPVSISLLLSIGTLRVTLETLDDVWDLYYPQNQPIAAAASRLRTTFTPTVNCTRTFCPFQTFGHGVSLPVLALVPGTTDPVEPGSNYLVGVHSLRSLCQFVENFTLQLNPSGTVLTFKDVCAYRLGETCEEPIVCSLLKNSNEDTLTLPPQFQALVLPKSATIDPVTHRVESTPAFRLVWHFKHKGNQRLRFRDSSRDPSALFIRALFDRLYQIKEQLGKRERVIFHLYSQIVQSDEMHSIVKNDSKLMVITVVLMSLFSVIVSVNRQQGVLKSRALLALAGVLTTCLAIGSAVGLLSMLKIKFIQCAFLAPFIMLGIGIDSTFVIMFTWAKECSKGNQRAGSNQATPRDEIIGNGVKKLDPSSGLNPEEGEKTRECGVDKEGSATCEEVIGNTMKNSFIAVFISNMTALLAFLVGSFTPYQAVNITCYYLATITLFLLLLQSTFLIGCLSLYHQVAVRHLREKRRRDSNGAKLSEGQSESCHDRSVVSFTEPQLKKVVEKGQEELPPLEVFNKLEIFISNHLHLFVMNNYVRVCCIFLVGVAVTLSLNRVIRMRQFINEMGYQPDDSRVIEFYRFSRVLYPADPMLVHFVIDQPIPYNQKSTRDLLDNLYRDISDNVWTLKSEFVKEPWFQLMPNRNFQMKRYMKELREKLGLVPESEQDFSKYMAGLANECYQNDVMISENPNEIVKSRFVVPFRKVDSSNFEQGYHLVKHLQNVTKSFPFKMYFTSTQLMLLERNSLMKRSIWWSIAIAIVCCSVVAWLLLPRLFLFLSVISTLALTMTTTMGFMAMLDMHYNIATYIIVLLLIGLCIDYISHSGHAYLCASQQLLNKYQRRASSSTNSQSRSEKTETVNGLENGAPSSAAAATGVECGGGGDERCVVIKREEVVELALRNIGVPLFNAALSSLLSVSMLGFGSSYVMRNMFKSMMLLFSCSFFYGVIFLPIILSFFGPEHKIFTHPKPHAKDQKPTLQLAENLALEECRKQDNDHLDLQHSAKTSASNGVVDAAQQVDKDESQA